MSFFTAEKIGIGNATEVAMIIFYWLKIANYGL